MCYNDESVTMKLVVAVLGIAAAAATIINDLYEAIDGVYTLPLGLRPGHSSCRATFHFCLSQFRRAGVSNERRLSGAGPQVVEAIATPVRGVRATPLHG